MHIETLAYLEISSNFRWTAFCIKIIKIYKETTVFSTGPTSSGPHRVAMQLPHQRQERRSLARQRCCPWGDKTNHDVE
jgi:hypothetical protein